MVGLTLVPSTFSAVGIMVYPATINHVREAYGLARKSTFSSMNPDANVATRLYSMYGSPDHVDAWVGGLAETHLPGAHVGELVATMLKEQFTRLMNGDPFFYRGDPDLENKAVRESILDLHNLKLADIIRRNTRLDISGGAHVLAMPSKIFN